MRTSQMSGVPALPEENNNIPGLHSIPPVELGGLASLQKHQEDDKLHYHTI